MKYRNCLKPRKIFLQNPMHFGKLAVTLRKASILTLLIAMVIISFQRSLAKEVQQKPTSGQIKLNEEFSFQDQDVFKITADSLQKLNEIIENSDSDTQSALLFQLGDYFRQKGDYNISAFYFFKGLEIGKELNDPNIKARFLTNLGINHSRSNNFSKSRLYYQKALDAYLEAGDSLRVSYLYNNISMQYYREGNYEEALDYYNTATLIKKKFGITGLKLNPNNPGQFYHRLGQFEKGLYYHHLALKYLAELPQRDIYKEALSHQYIGDVYVDMEDSPKALGSYQLSLKLARQIGAKKIIEKVLGSIAIVYLNLEDFRSAYYYNAQHKLYLDTLTRYTNQVSILEAQFEANIQEKELALLKAASDHEINQKNLIIIGISTTFIFSLGIIFLVFYNYRKSQEAALLINRKNELLKEQQINQLLQEKELKSMKAFIEGQEKERTRIARDLHDGLGGTLAGLRLNFERSIDKSLTDGLTQLTEGLDQVYQEIRTVASNLAPPKFQSTYFTDILSGYINDILQSNQIEINSEFLPEDEINLLPEKIKIELYRILQEIITNILKHASATAIEIQLLKHDQFINLVVEDNGKGFNANKKHKGMGVSNVHSRVALLNGKLDIDSKENRGTTFNIDIPVDRH